MSVQTHSQPEYLPSPHKLYLQIVLEPQVVHGENTLKEERL